MKDTSFFLSRNKFLIFVSLFLNISAGGFIAGCGSDESKEAGSKNAKSFSETLDAIDHYEGVVSHKEVTPGSYLLQEVRRKVTFLDSKRRDSQGNFYTGEAIHRLTKPGAMNSEDKMRVEDNDSDGKVTYYTDDLHMLVPQKITVTSEGLSPADQQKYSIGFSHHQGKTSGDTYIKWVGDLFPGVNFYQLFNPQFIKKTSSGKTRYEGSLDDLGQVTAYVIHKPGILVTKFIFKQKMQGDIEVVDDITMSYVLDSSNVAIPTTKGNGTTQTSNPAGIPSASNTSQEWLTELLNNTSPINLGAIPRGKFLLSQFQLTLRNPRYGKNMKVNYIHTLKKAGNVSRHEDYRSNKKDRSIEETDFEFYQEDGNLYGYNLKMPIDLPGGFENTDAKGFSFNSIQYYEPALSHDLNHEKPSFHITVSRSQIGYKFFDVFDDRNVITINNSKQAYQTSVESYKDSPVFGWITLGKRKEGKSKKLVEHVLFHIFASASSEYSFEITADYAVKPSKSKGKRKK